MGEAEYQVALEELRSLLAYCRAKSDAFNEMIDQRDKVLAAYGPVFTMEHAKELKAEEFKAFLLFENNKHWTGLHRQGGIICSNMRALRNGMASLLDESKDLATRLNQAVDGVKGMGKGIVTAILFVANPEKHGVWNSSTFPGLSTRPNPTVRPSNMPVSAWSKRHLAPKSPPLPFQHFEHGQEGSAWAVEQPWPVSCHSCLFLTY